MTPQEELQLRRKLEQGGMAPKEELAARRHLESGDSGSSILFGIPESPLLAAPIVGAAGFNTGLLSDTIGGLPDLVNAGLNLVGAGTERPFMGSQMIRENLAEVGIGLTKSDVEQLPEGMGPIFAGGRTIGQSVPFAAAPLAAARAGVQSAGAFTPILQSARNAPGIFAAAEATAATGAGVGRFGAEAFAPGDETVGMLAELGGGIFSPTALVGKALKGSLNFLNRISGSFTRTGREQNAANAVRRGVEKNQEDVATIIGRLIDPEDISGARPTAGQKSNSPALLALERHLTNKIAGLDNRIKDSTTDTLEAFRRAFDEAVEGGDAALVRQISQERERVFGSLIEARVVAAGQAAEEAAGRILPRGARAAQSARARKTLEDALRDARKAERGLWSELPRGLPIEPRSLDDSFQGVRAELLEEELLPAPVEAFLKRVQRSFEPPKADADGVVPEPEVITSGDLLRFRSRVLDLQRNVRGGATPDFGLARRLGLIADGALDDLAELPGTDAARGFSRQLNQLFTKGEVGNLLGFNARGDVKVAPELTLQTGIGSGGQSGAVASRQIEDAAQLQGLPIEDVGRQLDIDISRRTTASEQEDFVRELLVKAVDPTTSRVNARQLARLTRNNQELLERFPELKQAVGDAVTAQQALEATARLQGKSLKAVRESAAFAQVSKFEDPVRGVGSVLNSKTPLLGYRELARNAKKSGRAAVAGLRQATLSHLLNSVDGVPGTQLRRALNMKVGKTTLLDTMTKSGVLGSAQKHNLNRIISRTVKLEQAIASGQNIDEVFPDPSAIETMLIRIVGSRIGARGAAGAASGASLIAASAGSKFLRNLVQKIPTARTVNILEKAVEDPVFMAKLLNKGKTAGSRRRLEKALDDIGAFVDDSKLGKMGRMARGAGRFAFPPDQANAFLLQTAIPGTDQESQGEDKDAILDNLGLLRLPATESEVAERLTAEAESKKRRDLIQEQMRLRNLSERERLNEARKARFRSTGGQ